DDPVIPETPARPWSPFDRLAESWASVGGTIPESFRTTVEGLPYSQAVKKFRRWHAEEILAALTAAGIPHDSKVVRQALRWETVTENERDNDLGNLPRLCSALGLGGEWDQYVHQAENPPPPEEQACAVEPLPQPEFLKTVLACVSGLNLTQVQGGSIPLP